jgi:hypothetical protein
MYTAIAFAPDGDYITEGHFESIESAWDRINDWGSRWYFYPFTFVTTDYPSKTSRIVDACDFPYLSDMKHKSIKTVSQFIEKNGQELCDILNAH